MVLVKIVEQMPNLNVSCLYIYLLPMWYVLSRATAALICVFTSAVLSNFTGETSEITPPPLSVI